MGSMLKNDGHRWFPTSFSSRAELFDDDAAQTLIVRPAGFICDIKSERAKDVISVCVALDARSSKLFWCLIGPKDYRELLCTIIVLFIPPNEYTSRLRAKSGVAQPCHRKTKKQNEHTLWRDRGQQEVTADFVQSLLRLYVVCRAFQHLEPPPVPTRMEKF
jgi:hypothetical protein